MSARRIVIRMVVVGAVALAFVTPSLRSTRGLLRRQIAIEPKESELGGVFQELVDETSAVAREFAKLPPIVAEASNKGAVLAVGALASLPLAPVSAPLGVVGAVAAGAGTRIAVSPKLSEGRYQAMQAAVASALVDAAREGVLEQGDDVERRALKAKIADVVSSWNLDEDYAAGLLIKIYARFLGELMKGPEIDVKDAANLAKLADVLSLRIGDVGQAHYDAALDLVADAEDVADFAERKTDEYQYCTKLLYVSDRSMSRTFGATYSDEVKAYETMRLREAFGDLREEHVRERSQTVAQNFYAMALDAALQEVGAVTAAMLETTAFRLGLDPVTAAEMNYRAFTKTVRATMNVDRDAPPVGGLELAIGDMSPAKLDYISDLLNFGQNASVFAKDATLDERENTELIEETPELEMRKAHWSVVDYYVKEEPVPSFFGTDFLAKAVPMLGLTTEEAAKVVLGWTSPLFRQRVKLACSGVVGPEEMAPWIVETMRKDTWADDRTIRDLLTKWLEYEVAGARTRVERMINLFEMEDAATQLMALETTIRGAESFYRSIPADIFLRGDDDAAAPKEEEPDFLGIGVKGIAERVDRKFASDVFETIVVRCLESNDVDTRAIKDDDRERIGFAKMCMGMTPDETAWCYRKTFQARLERCVPEPLDEASAADAREKLGQFLASAGYPLDVYMDAAKDLFRERARRLRQRGLVVVGGGKKKKTKKAPRDNYFTDSEIDELERLKDVLTLAEENFFAGTCGANMPKYSAACSAAVLRSATGILTPVVKDGLNVLRDELGLDSATAKLAFDEATRLKAQELFGTLMAAASDMAGGKDSGKEKEELDLSLADPELVQQKKKIEKDLQSLQKMSFEGMDSLSHMDQVREEEARLRGHLERVDAAIQEQCDAKKGTAYVRPPEMTPSEYLREAIQTFVNFALVGGMIPFDLNEEPPNPFPAKLQPKLYSRAETLHFATLAHVELSVSPETDDAVVDSMEQNLRYLAKFLGLYGHYYDGIRQRVGRECINAYYTNMLQREVLAPDGADQAIVDHFTETLNLDQNTLGSIFEAKKQFVADQVSAIFNMKDEEGAYSGQAARMLPLLRAKAAALGVDFGNEVPMGPMVRGNFYRAELVNVIGNADLDDGMDQVRDILDTYDVDEKKAMAFIEENVNDRILVALKRVHHFFMHAEHHAACRTLDTIVHFFQYLPDPPVAPPFSPFTKERMKQQRMFQLYCEHVDAHDFHGNKEKVLRQVKSVLGLNDDQQL